MNFTEIVAPTIKELFIRRMTGLILRGELAVGQKLPSERELCEQMSVSKSIVHLGLEELSRMGFVRVLPRSGTYVADFVHAPNLDTLTAVLRYNGGVMGQDLQSSIIDMRSAVEGQALIQLASHCGEEDIAALTDIMEKLQSAGEAKKSSEKLGEIISSFHREICVRSGNMLYPIIMEAFEELMDIVWRSCTDFRSWEQAKEDGERIISLVERGDGQGAAEYLASSLNAYKSYPFYRSAPESTFSAALAE